MKLRTYVEKRLFSSTSCRHASASLLILTPSGSFKSNTKSVIATAKMPSTRATIRDFSIAHSRSRREWGVQCFRGEFAHALFNKVMSVTPGGKKANSRWFRSDGQIHARTPGEIARQP